MLAFPEPLFILNRWVDSWMDGWMVVRTGPLPSSDTELWTSVWLKHIAADGQQTAFLTNSSNWAQTAGRRPKSQRNGFPESSGTQSVFPAHSFSCTTQSVPVCSPDWGTGHRPLECTFSSVFQSMFVFVWLWGNALSSGNLLFMVWLFKFEDWWKLSHMNISTAIKYHVIKIALATELCFLACPDL